MLQAQISGKFAKPEQALECKVCDEPITYPSCHLAPHNSAQPMIPIQEGAIALIACPNHGSELVQRFQTGIQTQQQLTSGLSTTSSSL